MRPAQLWLEADCTTVVLGRLHRGGYEQTIRLLCIVKRMNRKRLNSNDDWHYNCYLGGRIRGAAVTLSAEEQCNAQLTRAFCKHTRFSNSVVPDIVIIVVSL